MIEQLDQSEQPRGAELSQIIGSTGVGGTVVTATGEATEEEDQDKLAKRLMSMARAAVLHANSSDLGKRKTAMSRSYQAYRGEHAAGSKYSHKNYSSRSKLNIPKTRAAVKSKMIAVNSALFGTEQAVSITAEDDADPKQLASADLNMALVNYRFDRGTGRQAGIPWQRIAIGAAADACIAGIAVSKTSWEFEESLEEVEEGFDPNDPDLDPDVLGMNGLPMRRRIVRDRPMLYQMEPENVIVDMAAPWWDVIQEGQFFIVKHPMKVGDIKSMMKPGAQHLGGGPWFNIPDKVMAAAVVDTSTTGVRSSRSGGQDRYGRMSQPAVSDFEVAWVHENFIRVDGTDYHFWSLGTKQLLSEPGPTGTIGHYPGHRGERPYVMGVGAIEPHVALPMSHVESWRPLQDEINDTVNLRLDAMKQAIAPITLYRMGANVDLRAVRERGPDATIGVSDLDKDIRFNAIPGPNPSIYAESDRLNSQFDELAGSFATSTVQSSRAIGETARGMQLVSSAANSIQEFDLAVFLFTWAEPTVRHIVWLEQYYETDEVLLTIMARKAQLFQRFGDDVALDDILDRQLTVRINIGPGTGDPLQKLQRINAALDMSMKIGEAIAGQVTPKAEELFSEIWSSTGVSAQRIFAFISPEEAEQKMQAQQQAQPNPDMMRVEAEREANQGRLQIEQQRLEMDKQSKGVDLQHEQQKLEMEREAKALDLQIAHEKSAMEREKLEIERANLTAEMNRADMELAMRHRDSQAQQGNENRNFAAQQVNNDRDFAAQQVNEDRNFVAQQTESDRAHTLARDQFDHTQQSAGRDFTLKAGAQNKQIIDEQQTDLAEGEKLPVGMAITDAADQLKQIMAMLAESQRAQTESIGMMVQQIGVMAQAQAGNVQAQAENSALLREVVSYQRAPRRILRDAQGRVAGVQIGDETQPVERDQDGRIDGM